MLSYSQKNKFIKYYLDTLLARCWHFPIDIRIQFANAATIKILDSTKPLIRNSDGQGMLTTRTNKRLILISFSLLQIWNLPEVSSPFSRKQSVSYKLCIIRNPSEMLSYPPPFFLSLAWNLLNRKCTFIVMSKIQWLLMLNWMRKLKWNKIWECYSITTSIHIKNT